MVPSYVPLESEEAHTLVAWMRVQGLRFHHSPGETGHTPEAKRRAIRVKREGTSKGFPDYIVLIPPERSVNGQGFTLYIELKRKKGGTISPEQREWIDAINALEVVPVAVYIARGADQAIDIIGKHLRPVSESHPF